MESEINKILNDLYAIDGGFRANESELRKIIANLLEVKPDTKFDEGFASRLRGELVSKPNFVRPVVSPFGSIFSYRVFYSVASAALTILIVVPITYSLTKNSNIPSGLVPAWTEVKNLSTDYTPKQEISSKGTNAFGKLDLITRNDSDSTPAAKLMSVQATTEVVQGEITFEYKGEQIKLNKERGEVFKLATVATEIPDPISIADIFLKGKAVDASLYGKPIKISDNLIIYPLLIKGTEVYTDSGTPFGLEVNVDGTRVAAISDPGIQKYESSDYALETDFNLVLNIATSTRQSFNGRSGTAVLSTPREVLMKQDNLFVPALMFKANYTDGLEGPTNIIVPIVKEFLAKNKNTTDNVAGVGVNE